MFSDMNKDRVMIFIDGRNLTYSAKHYGEDGVMLDMIKLKNQLSGEKSLIRSYWYDSIKPDSDNKREGFFDFLRTHGYRVVVSESKGSDGGYEEKGSDIKLACEMLHMAHIDAFDTAIMVSGDGDFAGAVRKVQDVGKKVKIATFDNHLSNNLNKASDATILLDDLVSQIRLGDTSDDSQDEAEQEMYFQLDDSE